VEDPVDASVVHCMLSLGDVFQAWWRDRSWGTSNQEVRGPPDPPPYLCVPISLSEPRNGQSGGEQYDAP
jgi:hypothetical protein